MSKEFTEPAFPIPRLSHDADFNGMSLRDYFAAKFAAAQSTATSQDQSFLNPSWVNPRDDLPESVAQKIARISYSLADAMLDERSR